MNANLAPSAFDYNTLTPDAAAAARASADRIRGHLAASYIAAGSELALIKKRLGHGQFGPWLRAEFGMSERSAENYMSAAGWLEGKSASVATLPPTLVYALASPTASRQVVTAVIEAADSGTPLAAEEVRARLQQAGLDRKAAAAAAAVAARTAEQRAREKANDKRRRAAERERGEREEAERRRIEKQRAAWIAKVAEFLLAKLGPDDTEELFRLAPPYVFSQIDDAVRRIRSEGSNVVAFRHDDIGAPSRTGAGGGV